MAKYDKEGRVEIPDPTPVEIPLGYEAPETLEQMIARLVVANDFRKSQEQQGMESFEEADDFDVEEDEFHSEHEMTPMQEEYLGERSAAPVKHDRRKEDKAKVVPQEKVEEPDPVAST